MPASAALTVPVPSAPRAPEDGDRSARPGASPPLRPWSRVWRYLVVVTVALLIWIAVSVDLLPEGGADLPPGDAEGPIGAALVLDLLLGVVGIALLPLRRRYPLVVAAVTAALTSFSGAAVGAAALATVSMSTHRRWRGVVVTGVVWLAAGTVYEGLYRPAIPGVEVSTPYLVAATALAVVAYAACVATGFYIGARRELLVTLHERAETAEREVVLRADAAREAERTRIAREMHDVLAHRISLVAMHAGALVYRTDLTRAETTEAAAVIQDNAHHALAELRQVLGVLRAGAADLAGSPLPEPPQPSLRELPALLAENGEAGTPVRLDVTGMPRVDAPLALAPPTLSRTAFRIVQEVLTNARKHAPGAEVTLVLAGLPGSGLSIEASNPVPLRRAAGPTAGPPGAGMGLTGLEERAALAGGSLVHGLDAGQFRVVATLPWAEP